MKKAGEICAVEVFLIECFAAGIKAMHAILKGQ